MAKDDDSVPAWQKASSETQNDHKPVVADGIPPDIQYTEVEEMPPVPSRKEAKAFLDHPGTKEADPMDKLRFLEMKNAKREDIEALIPEAKAHYAKLDAKEEKELAAYRAEAAAQAVPERQTPSLAGPVVTVPEFLVKSRRPPPLVSMEMLLNTFYVTVGAVAGMYGLSKYYLNPMHEELSEARHEFFGFAGDKVDELNARLAKLVTVPPSKVGHERKDPEEWDAKSEESDASDPTELFHRDVGVQTSPPLSRNQSTWSLSELDNSSATATLSHQEARIASLTSSIRDLRFSRDMSGNKEKDVTAQVDAFGKYLNEMMLSSPYYKYQNSFPTWSNPTPTNTQDEMEKFKSEIRSMKGARLSTRNFPRHGGVQ